jgi:hypothetical protein
MSATLTTITACALVVVFVAGFIASFRAHDRMMKRRRYSGYRFRPFAGFSAHDFTILVVGMVVMVLSFLGLKVLQ